MQSSLYSGPTLYEMRHFDASNLTLTLPHLIVATSLVFPAGGLALWYYWDHAPSVTDSQSGPFSAAFTTTTTAAVIDRHRVFSIDGSAAEWPTWEFYRFPGRGGEGQTEIPAHTLSVSRL